MYIQIAEWAMTVTIIGGGLPILPLRLSKSKSNRRGYKDRLQRPTTKTLDSYKSPGSPIKDVGDKCREL